ncbi:unnamed protein product [Callosobruchus maculatus]|uniref:Cyclic nucleotide-binding domain-containing protein n=1 Tax=Callosobruchus maculatus TaxID=64391 RepID=A0A653C909_CALMS|nr:unnamed protein product [Callosobruchus maculatus]
MLAILTYIVGKVLICTIYVILAVTLLSSRSMEIKFIKIIDQLDEYMRQKQLPLELRERIRNFYDFKYQGKYFKEVMIHDMLSAKLKTDIKLHVCRSLIMNVSLFAGLTAEQISTVVDLVTPEIFLPKDTIFQSGSDANCMYFIASGTVAVYTHSGSEVCHLEDGAYFGEVSLVLRIPHRCATIIAIETTQVYVLKKTDFNVYLLKNRKVMKAIRKVAQKRYTEILEHEAQYKRTLFEQEHGRQPHGRQSQTKESTISKLKYK